MFLANAISNGTMIIPVTVLLEKSTFIKDTPNTTEKTIATGDKWPNLLKAT